MSSQKSTKTITMKKLFSMVVLVFSIIMTSFTFGGCSLFGNINTTSSMFDEAGNLRLVTPLLDFHESKEYYVHKNETTGEEEQVVPVLDVGPKSFTTNNSDVVEKVIASFVNATEESKSAALTAGLYATFTATGPLNTATNQMPVSLTLQRKTSDTTISAYPLEGLFVDSGIKYNIISAAINLSLDSNRNWTFGDGTGTTASLADIAEHSFVEDGSNSRFINIVGNDITLLDNNVSTGDKKLIKQTYVDETTGSFSFELGYYWRNENVNNMFFDSKNNPVKQINNVKYDAAGYYNTPAGGESYDSALITTADRLNDANANIAFPNYMLLLDDKQLEIRLDNITYGIAPGNKLSPLINLKADIYYKTNYNNDMVWVKAEKSYFDIYQNKSNGMWMIRYNPRLENGTTSRVLKVRALSNDSNRGDSLYSGGVVFDVYRQTFTTYSNNSAYIDYGYLNYSDDMTPASPLGNNTYGGESRYIDPAYGTFSDATNPTKNYYFYDVQKKIDTTTPNSELRTVSLTGYFPQGKIVQVQRCLIDTDYAFQSWTTNTAAENGRVFTNTIYKDISYPLAIDSANYEYCLDYSLTLTDRGFVAVPTDDNRFSSIGDSIYFYGKNTALREAMANLFWDNLDTTTARGTYENISSVLTSVSHASTHNFKFYANYGKVNNFTLSGSIFNGDNLFDIGDQYLNGFNLTLYYYDGTNLQSHTYNPFAVGEFDPNDEYTTIINNRIITISGHNYIVSGLQYGDSISFGKQSTPAADDYATYSNKAAFNFYSVKMVERDLGGYIKNVLEVRQPDNYVTGLDFYSDRTNVGIVGTQYKSNSNLQINIYVAGQDNLDSSAPAAVYNTSSGDLVIADGTDLKYEIIKTSDSYIDDFGYITTNVVIALQTESDSSIFSYNFETISSMNDVRFLNGGIFADHYAYEHYYNALTLQYEKKPIMYKVTSLNSISVNAEVPGQTYKTGNAASGYTLYDFAYKEGNYYFYKIQDKYIPAPLSTNDASTTYIKYLVTQDHSSWSALKYTPVSSVARLGTEITDITDQNTRDYLTYDGDYSFRFQETYYNYDSYGNEIVITRDFFANSNDAYIVRTRTQNRTRGETSYAFHNLYLPDLDNDDSTNSGFTMKSPTEIKFGGAIYTQETPSASSTSTVAKVYKTDMLQYETTYKLEEVPAVNIGDPVGTYNKVSKDVNKSKSSYIYAYYDVAKASNGKYFLTAQLGIRTSIPQFNGGEIYNYKFYFEALGDELYTDPNSKLEEQAAQSNFSSLLGGSILLGSDIVARATAADANENIRAFYLLMGAKLTANAYYYVKPLEEATDAYVSQAVETISTKRNVVSYEYSDGSAYTGDVTAKIEMSDDFIYTDSEGNNYTKDQITLKDTFYELNAAGEYVPVITSGTNAITINTSYVLVVYNNTSPTYFKQNPGATITSDDVLKPKKYSEVEANFMLPEGTTPPADNSYCYIYPIYSYNAVHKKYQLTFTPKGQTEAINVQLAERNLPFLDDLFGYQIIDSAAALKVEIKLDGGKYLAGFTLTNSGSTQAKENIELTRLRGSLYYKDYIICDAFETGVYTDDKLTLEYNYNKIVGLYLGTLRVMDYDVFNAIAVGSSQNIDTIDASSIWNTENAKLAKHLFPDSTVYVHDKLAYSVHSLALADGITYTAEIDFTNNLSNKFKTIPLTYTGNVDPDGNHLFTYNNGGYIFTFFVTASQFARIDDETGSTSDQVLDLINETAKNDEVINNFWTYAQYILSSNDFNSDFNAFDFASSLQVNAYNEELIIVTVKGGTVSGRTVYVTSYSPTFITKHFDKNGTEIKQVTSTEKQDVNIEKLVRSATLKNNTDITILGKYTVTNNPDEPIVYPTYTTKLIYTTVIKINDQDETIEINKPGDGQVVKSQGGFDHYYSLDYTIPNSVIEGMPGVSLLDGPPYPNPVLYFSIRHIAGEQAVVNISLEVKSAFTIEVMGSKVDSDKDLLLDFSTFAFRDTLANLNYNYYMDNIYYVIEKATFKPFSAYYEISLDKYNLLPENAKYMQDGHYYALWNSGEPLTIQNVGLNDGDPYIYFIDEMTADGAYTKNVYYLVDDGFGGYKMAKLTEETAYIWESSADSMKDLPIYDLHAYEQGKDGIIYFTSGNYSDDNTVCEGLEGLKAGATNKTDGVFDYTNVLIAGTVDAYRTDIQFNADGQEYLGYWQYNPVSTINAYDSSDAQFIAGKEAAVFVASPIVRVADPTAINTGVLYRFSHWLVYTRYNTEVMYLNRDYTYDSHGRYANTGAIMTFAPAENESGYFVFMPCYQRVLTIDVGTAVFDGPANLGGMVTFQYNGGEAVDATDPKDYDLYLLEYYKTTYGNKEGYFYTEVETTPYYVVTGFERVTMEGAAGTAYDYIKPIYAPADQYTIFKVAFDLPGTGTVYIYQYYDHSNKSYGTFGNSKTLNDLKIMAPGIEGFGFDYFDIDISPDPNLAKGNAHITGVDLLQYITYIMLNRFNDGDGDDNDFTLDEVGDTFMLPTSIGPLLAPVTVAPDGFSIKYSTAQIFAIAEQYESFLKSLFKSFRNFFTNAAESMFGIKIVTMSELWEAIDYVSNYNNTEYVHYSKADELYNNLNYGYETSFVPESLADTEANYDAVSLRRLAYRDIATNTFYAVDQSVLTGKMISGGIDESFFLSGDKFAHLFTKDFLAISALASYETGNGYFANSENALLSGELYYNEDGQVNSTIQYKDTYFDRDSSVILTATPDYGYRFEGWYQAKFNEYTNTWQLSDVKLTDAAATYSDEIIAAVYNQVNQEFYYITEYYSELKQDLADDGSVISYREYYLDEARTKKAIVPESMLDQIRGSYIIQNNKYVQIFYSAVRQEYYYDAALSLPVVNGHMYTRYTMTHYEVADRFYNPTRYTAIDDARGINTSSYAQNGFKHPTKFFTVAGETYNRYFRVKENGNVYVNGNTITIQKLHSNLRFVAKFIENYQLNNVTAAGDDEGIVVVDMMYYNTDALSGKRPTSNVRSDVYGNDLTIGNNASMATIDLNADCPAQGFGDDDSGAGFDPYYLTKAEDESQTLSTIVTDNTKYTFNFGYNWSQVSQDINGSVYPSTSYWVRHTEDSELSNENLYFDVNTTVFVMVKVKRGFSLSLHTLGFGSAAAYNVTPILEPNEDYLKNQTQGNLASGESQVDFFYYLFKITFDRNMDSSENDNAHLIRHPYRAQSVVGDILSGRDYDFYGNYFTLYDNEGFPIVNDYHGVEGYVEYSSANKTFNLLPWNYVRYQENSDGKKFWQRFGDEEYKAADNYDLLRNNITNKATSITELLIEMSAFLKNEFAFYVDGVTTIDQKIQKNINGREYELDLFANGGKITEPTNDMNTVFAAVQTITRLANPTGNKSVGPFTTGTTNFFNLSGLVIYTYTVQSMLVDSVNADGTINYRDDAPSITEMFAFSAGGSDGSMIMNAHNVISLTNPFEYKDVNPAQSTIMYFSQLYNSLPMLDLGGDVKSTTKTEDLAVVANTMLLLGGFGKLNPDNQTIEIKDPTTGQNFAFVGWYESKCQEIVNADGTITREWTNYELMSTDLITPYVSQANADTSIIALFKRVKDFEFKFNSKEVNITINGYQYDGSDFTYSEPDSDIITISGKVYVDQQLSITLSPNGGYRFNLDDSKQNIKINNITEYQNGFTYMDPILTTSFKNYLGKDIEVNDLIYNDICSFTINLSQFSQVGVTEEDLIANANLPITLEIEMTPILLFFFEVEGYFVGGSWNNVTFELPGYFTTQSNHNYNSWLTGKKDDTNALMTIKVKGDSTLQVYGYFDRDHDGLEIKSSVSNASTAIRHYYINNYNDKSTANLQSDNPGLDIHNGNLFPIRFMYEGSEAFLNDENHFALRPENVLYHIAAKIDAKHEIEIGSLFYSAFNAPTHLGIASDKIPDGLINFTFDGTRWISEGVQENNGYISVNDTQTYYFLNQVTGYFSINQKFVEIDSNKYMFVGFEHAGELYTNQASYELTTNVYAKFVRVDEISINNASEFAHAGSYSVSGSTFTTSDATLNSIVDYNGQLYHVNGTALDISVTPSDRFIPTQAILTYDATGETITKDSDITAIDANDPKNNSATFNYELVAGKANVVINYSDTIEVVISGFKYQSIDLSGDPTSQEMYYSIDLASSLVKFGSGTKSSTITLYIVAGKRLALNNLLYSSELARMKIDGGKAEYISSSALELFPTKDMTIELCFVPNVTITTYQTTKIVSGLFNIVTNSAALQSKIKYQYIDRQGISSACYGNNLSSYAIPNGTLLTITGIEQFATYNSKHYAYVGFTDNLDSTSLISTESSYKYKINETDGKVDFIFKHSTYTSTVVNVEITLGEELNNKLENAFTLTIKYKDTSGVEQKVDLKEDLFNNLYGDVYKYSYSFTTINTPSYNFKIAPAYADKYTVTYNKSTNTFVVKGAKNLTIIGEIDGSENSNDSLQTVSYFNGKASYVNVSGLYSTSFDTDAIPVLTAQDIPGKSFAGWYINGEFKTTDKDIQLDDSYGSNILAVAKYLSTNSIEINRVVDGSLSTDENLQVGVLGHFVTSEANGLTSKIKEQMLGSATTLTFTTRTNKDITLIANNTDEHVFLGWYSGSNLVSDSFVYDMTIGSNITLTAKFAKKFNISLIATTVNGTGNTSQVGGIISTNISTPYYTSENYSAGLIVNANATSGYTFAGFYVNGVYQVGSYNNPTKAIALSSTTGHLLIEAKFVKNFELDIRLAVADLNTSTDVQDLLGAEAYGSITRALTINFSFPDGTSNELKNVDLKNGNILSKQYADIPFGTKVTLTLPENINNATNYNFAGYYIYNNEQASTSTSLYSYQTSFTFFVEDDTYIISKYADNFTAPYTNSSSYYFINESGVIKTDATAITLSADNTYVYGGNTYLFVGWYSEVRDGIYPTRMIKVSDRFTESISNKIIHRVAKFVKVFDSNFTVNYNDAPNINVYSFTANFFAAYDAGVTSTFASVQVDNNAYKFKALLGTTYVIDAETIRGFGVSASTPDDTTFDRVTVTAGSGNNAHVYNAVMTGYEVVYTINNGVYFHNSSDDNLITSQTHFVLANHIRGTYYYTIQISNSNEEVQYKVIVTDIYGQDKTVSTKNVSNTNSSITVTVNFGELVTIVLLSKSAIIEHKDIKINGDYVNYRNLDSEKNLAPFYQFYANGSLPTILIQLRAQNSYSVNGSGGALEKGTGSVETKGSTTKTETIDGEQVTKTYTTIQFTATATEGYALSHVMWQKGSGAWKLLTLDDLGLTTDDLIIVPTTIVDKVNLFKFGQTLTIIREVGTLLDNNHAITQLIAQMTFEDTAEEIKFAPYFVKLTTVEFSGISPTSSNFYKYDYLMYNTSTDDDPSSGWATADNLLTSNLAAGEGSDSDMREHNLVNLFTQANSKYANTIFDINHKDFVDITFENQSFDLTYDSVNSVNDQVVFSTNNSGSFIQVVVNYSELRTYLLQVRLHADISINEDDYNNIKAYITINGRQQELTIKEINTSNLFIRFNNFTCHLSDLATIRVIDESNPQRFYLQFYANSRDPASTKLSTSESLTITKNVGYNNANTFVIYAHMQQATRTITLNYRGFNPLGLMIPKTGHSFIVTSTGVSGKDYIVQDNNSIISTMTITYPVGRELTFTTTISGFETLGDPLDPTKTVYESPWTNVLTVILGLYPYRYRFTGFTNAKTNEILSSDKHNNSLTFVTNNSDMTISANVIELVQISANVVEQVSGSTQKTIEVYNGTDWIALASGSYIEPGMVVRTKFISNTNEVKNVDKNGTSILDKIILTTNRNAADGSLIQETVEHYFIANSTTTITADYKNGASRQYFVISLAPLHGLLYEIEKAPYKDKNFTFAIVESVTSETVTLKPTQFIFLIDIITGRIEEYPLTYTNKFEVITDTTHPDYPELSFNITLTTKFKVVIETDLGIISKTIDKYYFGFKEADELDDFVPYNNNSWITKDSHYIVSGTQMNVMTEKFKDSSIPSTTFNTPTLFNSLGMIDNNYTGLTENGVIVDKNTKITITAPIIDHYYFKGFYAVNSAYFTTLTDITVNNSNLEIVNKTQPTFTKINGTITYDSTGYHLEDKIFNVDTIIIALYEAKTFIITVKNIEAVVQLNPDTGLPELDTNGQQQPLAPTGPMEHDNDVGIIRGNLLVSAGDNVIFSSINYPGFKIVGWSGYITSNESLSSFWNSNNVLDNLVLSWSSDDFKFKTSDTFTADQETYNNESNKEELNASSDYKLTTSIKTDTTEYEPNKLYNKTLRLNNNQSVLAKTNNLKVYNINDDLTFNAFYVTRSMLVEIEISEILGVTDLANSTTNSTEVVFTEEVEKMNTAGANVYASDIGLIDTSGNKISDNYTSYTENADGSFTPNLYMVKTYPTDTSTNYLPLYPYVYTNCDSKGNQLPDFVKIPYCELDIQKSMDPNSNCLVYDTGTPVYVINDGSPYFEYMNQGGHLIQDGTKYKIKFVKYKDNTDTNNNGTIDEDENNAYNYYINELTNIQTYSIIPFTATTSLSHIYTYIYNPDDVTDDKNNPSPSDKVLRDPTNGYALKKNLIFLGIGQTNKEINEAYANDPRVSLNIDFATRRITVRVFLQSDNGSYPVVEVRAQSPTMETITDEDKAVTVIIPHSLSVVAADPVNNTAYASDFYRSNVFRTDMPTTSSHAIVKGFYQDLGSDSTKTPKNENMRIKLNYLYSANIVTGEFTDENGESASNGKYIACHDGKKLSNPVTIEFLYELYDSEYYFNNTAYQIFNNNFANYNITIIQGTETYLSKLDEILRVYFGNVENADPENINHFFSKYPAFGDYVRDNSSWWKSNITYRETDKGRKNLYATCFNVIIAMMNALTSYGGSDKSFITEGYLNFDNIFDSAEQLNLKNVSGVYNLYNMLLGTNFTSNSDINSFFRYKTINVKAYFDFLKDKVYNNGSDVQASYLASNFSQMLAVNYNYGDTIRVDALVNAHKQEQYNESISKAWWIFPEIVWWASKGYMYLKQLTECNFTITSGLTTYNPKVTSALESSEQQEDLSFFQAFGQILLSPVGDMSVPGTNALVYTTTTPNFDNFKSAKSGGNPATLHMTLNGDDDHRIYYEAREWDSLPVGQAAIAVVAVVGTIVISVVTFGAGAAALMMTAAILTAVWLTKTIIDKFPNNSPLRNLFP